jgi:hypothetical protein
MMSSADPIAFLDKLAGSLFNWAVCLSVAIPLPAIVVSYTRLLTHKLNQIERLLIGSRAERFYQAFGYSPREEGADAATYTRAEESTAARRSALANHGNGKRSKREPHNPEFQSTFRAYYNWYSYALGLALLAIVAVAFAAAALASLGLSLFPLPADVQRLLAAAPPRALAAAAGAYLFGAWDAVRRYRTVDLYPSVLHYLWVRILVSAFVGYVVGVPFKEPADVLAAFAVGVFPLGDLWSWLRTRVDIAPRSDPVEPNTMRLIQGLESEESRERLADEGISSVQHLAYADPVGLLFRTNLEWNVILDLIDQAILVLYLGESVAKLRPLANRSAVEFATIDNRLHSDDATEVQLAEKLVKSIAERLELPEEAVRNLTFQLNNDPIVEFIWDHWSATIGTTQGETAVGIISGPPQEGGVSQMSVAADVPPPA